MWLFLSSLAQDFIEERVTCGSSGAISSTFLSSLAQDFIEDKYGQRTARQHRRIPEFSSSGLH